MRRKMKPFEKLTITDDFMFCKVMQNPKFCKKLLKMILGRRIGKIIDIRYQHVVDEGGDIKGIRLDIMVKDGRGCIYDIEMQMSRKAYLPKRMRYYCSLIDTTNLPAGTDYDKLPENIIIFLCSFDLFGRGLPVYTFKNICLEDTAVELKDGTTKIIINSKAADKVKDPELRAFLDYMNGTLSEDRFIVELEDEVQRIRQNHKWRKEYMTLSVVEMDAKREGRKEGRREGRKAAQEAAIKKMANYLCSNDSSLSLEDATAKAAEILR